MADENDNLVRRPLREIRATQDAHTEMPQAHGAQFRRLNKEIEDRQETTATSLGFAAPADMRVQAIETELDELRKRHDRLGRTQ